ncbi:hypothetical protein Tco_0808934 [Tanacetum coccineum]
MENTLNKTKRLQTCSRNVPRLRENFSYRSLRTISGTIRATYEAWPGSVPEPFSLSVLRRLGSIFTSFYAAVQKLKKKVYKAGKGLLYVKRNKAISLGNGEVSSLHFIPSGTWGGIVSALEGEKLEGAFVVTSRKCLRGEGAGKRDDQMNSVINCLTSKSTWDDLILYHEGPLINTNHVKDSELASLFGKLKYEENLIDSIYKTEKRKSLVSATPLSTAFFSTSIVQDFQGSPDNEEDTRSKVSSNDNEVTEVKALMALADEERVSVGKESARNGEWIKISIKKEQRNNLMSKHRNLIQELNTCKEQLLILKQTKLDLLTMQHVNTKILKENQNLRNELKELTSIIEAWLNSSNKVNQCISEQISTQKKKILVIDQLTEDTSSPGPNDPVFVKSSADNSEAWKLAVLTIFTLERLPEPDLDAGFFVLVYNLFYSSFIRLFLPFPIFGYI